MAASIRLRKSGKPTRLEEGTLPPPEGLNTLDSGPLMPQTDAVELYNMIRDELGLRTRLGSQEWNTGLTGNANNEVRTMIPFQGSTTTVLFAATSTGIYNCTAQGVIGAKVATFATATGLAGYGTSVMMSSPAGRFCLYVDEVNGYWVYTEGTATWVQVVNAASTAWANGTAYLLNATVTNNGVTYKCTTAGTSDVAPATGPNGTGVGIADGTAVWAYTPSMSGLDPASAVHITVWKSRVWVVERNSTRAWFLGVNALFGPASPVDFGVKARAGGTLIGLWNWSYDGGAGLDTLLAGVTTGGDVIIYAGTNPALSTSFSIKGCWYVGPPPVGRRCCTEFGGDLLVLGSLGLVPMSKLVVGDSALDRSQYLTAKVQNLINYTLSVYGSVPGWQVVAHPQDNCLMVVVPPGSGGVNGQLVMSFATKGWSQYRDLPILHAATFNGVLYFGTPDGRVMQNVGYVDGITLAAPANYVPVAFSLVTSFWNGGTVRRKQVRRIQPTFIAQGNPPTFNCQARYGYNLSEADSPAATAAAAAAASWDTAKWDQGLWAGSYFPLTAVQGSNGGSNRDVAIAIAGYASSRTSLVKIDVLLEQGGQM